MSSDILGSVRVHYTNDTNGDKQLTWIGSAAPSATITTRQLYSALQDLFDNSAQMDEGVPMSAQTPTAFTIGQVETNDAEPWFIDPLVIQHLSGGSITTTGWTRSPLVGDGTGTIGIIKIQYTVGGGTDLAANLGDVGKTIADGTNSDSGKILYYTRTADGAAANEIWIRPDSNTAADNFDNSPQNTDLDVSGGTGTNLTQTTATAAVTGERLWSNIFTIGTISDDTRIFVAQNETVLENYWSDGDDTTNQIDRLFLVSDGFDSTWAGLIDGGYLTVYARQYSELYDHFVTDVSGGGRTAVPLSTQNDLNNTTGIRLISVSSSSAFSAGDTMRGLTSGAFGIVTAVPDSTTLHYYLVRDVTVDFSNGESIEAPDSSATTATSVPSNVPDDATYDGPASLTNPITISYNLTGYQADVNSDSTNEEYSIQIDVNSNSLATLYEYLKYVTRRGSTTSLNGVEGEQYIGVDYRLDYTTEGAGHGSLTVGTQVYGSTSGATGIVVKEQTTSNYVMLMNSQGTFVNGENLTDSSGATVYFTSIVTATPIPPNKQASFGSFAGGRFFGARGVYLTNVPGSDANNYELVDDGGNTITPPISVSFELTGVAVGSEVKIINNDLTSTRDVEIYGEETTVSTTVSFTYTYTAPNITYTSNLSGNSYTLTSPISATVIVFDYDFKEVRLNVSLGDTAQSIPVQQITERNYSGSF